MTGWINGLIEAVLNAVTSAAQAALNWLLGLLSATVFSSPDVTVVPQVTTIAGRAQLAANGCMALIVTIVGLVAMTHGGVQDRYSLKELLPRMLIGFGAANLATPIVRAAIAGANALTDALTAGTFTSQDSFQQFQRVLLDAGTDPAMALVAAVLQILALFMLGLLLVTWLGRLTVLLVLAGTAPAALMCHALPQTDPLARIWWRGLLGCLTVQVLQAVTLHLTVATLLSSDANLPALGFPHDPSGLLNLLIACFLLWLVIRIPAWVARSLGGNAGRGGHLLGSIVRVVVVQQMLGAVGLRGGRRLGRRPAASGPRPPTTHLHAHQHTNSHKHLHLHAQSGRSGRGSGAPASGAGRPAHPHGGRISPSLPGGTGAPPTGAVPRRYGARVVARPVRPYTRQELADGVDLYTRALKRRAGPPPPRSSR